MYPEPAPDAASRRQFLQAAAGIAAIGTAGCSSLQNTASDDGASNAAPDDGAPNAGPDEGASNAADGAVPTFRYDAANTGRAPEGTGPTESASVDWTVETAAPIRSSPTVVDDAVIVGGTDGTLRALSLDAGDEQWRFEHDGRFLSTPAVTESLAVVGSTDGSVYAIERGTGDEQWQFDADGSVLSSPTVVDGAVFVGSSDGSLYALGASTGDVDWTFQPESAQSNQQLASGRSVTGTRALASARSATRARGLAAGPGPSPGVRDQPRQPEHASTPAVVDGTAYVAVGSTLAAVDADSGEREWTTSLDALSAGGDRRVGQLSRRSSRSTGPLARSARTDASAGPIHASAGPIDASAGPIDASAGPIHATAGQITNAVPTSPAVDGDVVFLGQHPDVYAIDASDGSDRWQQLSTAASDGVVRPLRTDATRSTGSGQVSTTVESSPAVDGGTVYAGGRGLVALERDTGSVAWEAPVDSAVRSSPAIVDGTVYAGCDDGTVRAFAAEDGQERWRVATDAPVWSSPAVADGRLFVGSDDGTLYAVSGD